MLKNIALPCKKQILLAIGGYGIISALIYLSFLYFDAPFTSQQVLFGDLSSIERFWNFQVAALVMFVEIGIILLLTKGYKKERIQMEKPKKAIAKRELMYLLIYLVAVQLGGLLIGVLLNMHAISFHLPGSIYGSHDQISAAQMVVWALYNFIFYVFLPVAFFISRKKYNLRQLNILSTRNVGRDIFVIVTFLSIEILIQLGGFSDAFLKMGWQDMLQGSLTAFAFNLLGTALPTAIFIYALLFPRYQAVFKSPVVVIILGGLTYMGVHLFDSWMVFTSVGALVTSMGALFLQYFMPGVIKSLLTYRTGNPWVHLWAYHAIAPHVILDAPHFVDTQHSSLDSHIH